MHSTSTGRAVQHLVVVHMEQPFDAVRLCSFHGTRDIHGLAVHLHEVVPVGPVFDLDGGTLVAFDLAWRPLDAPSVRALVLACGQAPDGYALSSLICYHHSTRHYVVFVRVEGTFLYFNDLHHDAAHQHLSLEAVSALCGDRFLQPRLALHGRAV